MNREKGSIFSFILNVKFENSISEETFHLNGIRKILIVDDNRANRLIIRDSLLFKNIGYEEADSGTEALNLLEKNSYDIVIMDYHMTEMNGLETVRRLRNSSSVSDRNVPIILFHSSSDDDTVSRHCRELQIPLRIVKPVKMKDLFSVLEKMQMPDPENNQTHAGDGQKEDQDQKTQNSPS